jgi:hypothetical protein
MPESTALAGETEMASAYLLKTKRDYGDKTRIDMNQSFQVAYWKERFGVTEQELSEAVRAAGALARKVETYLGQGPAVVSVRKTAAMYQEALS